MPSPSPADDSRILTEADVRVLPFFPLPDAVLIPGALLPLHVFEPRYREMAHHVLAGDRLLAVARLRPGFELDYQGRPPVYEVCGVGEVVDDTRRSDGRYDIVLKGLARVRIADELPPLQTYRTMRAELLGDQARGEPATAQAWQMQLALLWQKLGPQLPPKLRDLRAFLGNRTEPGVIADRIGAAILADPDDRQRLLEELDPAERLALLAQHIQELLGALTGGRTLDLN
ncbi:MAG TPA: LON peptidase substrate-binding domain-containing protein [Polyangiaceae bacterium]|jgi:hypothetical protein